MDDVEEEEEEDDDEEDYQKKIRSVDSVTERPILR